MSKHTADDGLGPDMHVVSLFEMKSQFDHAWQVYVLDTKPEELSGSGLRLRDQLVTVARRNFFNEDLLANVVDDPVTVEIKPGCVLAEFLRPLVASRKGATGKNEAPAEEHITHTASARQSDALVLISYAMKLPDDAMEGLRAMADAAAILAAKAGTPT